MTMVENRRIQDLICDVKVPTETVMEDQFDKTGNKIGEKEVQRKIYPGYVFVKMVMYEYLVHCPQHPRLHRFCRPGFQAGTPLGGGSRQARR